MNRRTHCALAAALGLALSRAAASDGHSAIGITEPFLRVELSAAVSGIITVRPFKEGASVQQGQVLIELDKTLEELETTRRGLAADEKKLEYDSTKLLFEKTKAIAKEDLLKKEIEYKVAVVERDMAAEQLKRRVITAPFSGQITELLLEVGEACQPYQPLVKLVDTSRCHAVVNLEAKQAARLKLDQSLKLEVDTGAAPVTVTAKVIFISPVVDPASGLVKVRAVFDNPDLKIRPGLPARMILE